MHVRSVRTSPLAAVLLLVLGCSAACTPAAAEQQFEAAIASVNDGDTVTLRIEGRRRKARLIGIDAPEMGQEPWGARSRDHLKRLVDTAGRKVVVETDLVERDKYGRLLAYLWTKDGILLNERMLSDGYAVLFTIQPNSRHVDRLVKAVRTAKDRGAGIWGPDGLNETPLDYKKRNPRP